MVLFSGYIAPVYVQSRCDNDNLLETCVMCVYKYLPILFYYTYLAIHNIHINMAVDNDINTASCLMFIIGT